MKNRAKQFGSWIELALDVRLLSQQTEQVGDRSHVIVQRISNNEFFTTHTR